MHPQFSSWAAMTFLFLFSGQAINLWVWDGLIPAGIELNFNHIFLFTCCSFCIEIRCPSSHFSTWKWRNYLVRTEMRCSLQKMLEGSGMVQLHLQARVRNSTRFILRPWGLCLQRLNKTIYCTTTQQLPQSPTCTPGMAKGGHPLRVHEAG